jgi:Zn-finger nucleic acid-binding protein
VNCPACGNPLSPVTAGAVTVDVCQGGCGGMWFDNRELKQFDEPTEDAGALLLQVATDPDLQLDPSRRRLCPKCDNMPLMRHFASVKRQVEVDECPNCAGLFLDRGELANIRGEFASEAEKKNATRHLLAAETVEHAVESTTEVAEDRGLAGFFRFLSWRPRGV